MRVARAGAGWFGWAGWAALALALASCKPSAEAIADGEDPLAALAGAAESARYDGPYWTREAHRDSRTWRAARAFCAQARGRALPNCHAVQLVERWEGAWRTGTLPPLPTLPAPPRLPPSMHPDEPGRAGADLSALQAWEVRLAARGRNAAAGGPR
jgi:hypothetical protein